MILNFWNSIVNAGVTATNDQHIQRKIRLSNMVSFSGIIVVLIFAMVWFLNEEFKHATYLLFLVFALVLVIIMNHLGIYRFSRFIGICSSLLFLFYYALLGGRGIGIQYVFMMNPIIIFMVFDFKKERSFIYSLLCFLAFLIIVLETYAFDHVTPIAFTPTQLKQFYYIHVVVSFSMTLVFLIILLKDTTKAENELQEKQQELETEKSKAEKTAQIKSEFLSNMSHEMRTPLNSILGFTEILESSTLDNSQQEYIGYVKKASNNMLSLVNDVLDFSKFDSSDFTLHKHPFNLSSLLNEVHGMLSVAAKAKQLHFSYTLDPSIHPHIIGDANRIKQIILNVLSNAIKFTHKGEVTLSVSLKNKQQHKQEICFKISDSGIGIQQEDLQVIFDSFRQLENSNHKEYKGTGLGLAIVKQLVKAIGGAIEVESVINKGSTFTITLPFEISEKTPRIFHDDDAEIPLIKASNILVVEDNEMNQILIKKMLSIYEANTTIANDGYEALSLLKDKKYDIVLMDLQMPGLSGLDVYDQLIKDPQYAINCDTPVVIITADAFIETRKKALNHGVRAFLTKPINREELYKTMNACLKRY